jgi:hypothetical protein
MLGGLRRRPNVGYVVAVVVLVLAMSGGAWAAGGYVIKSLSQIKPSVRRALKGNAGPVGPVGPVGSAGAAGAGGAAGEKGVEGKAGTNGTNGTNGKSVKVEEEAPGLSSHCKEGGSNFEVEGSGKKTGYACNGSPWTAGGTLPKGKTENGTWSTSLFNLSEGSDARIPLSFPIPSPSAGKAYILDEAETLSDGSDPHGCTGTVEEPTAPEGVLCVYTYFEDIEGTVKPGSIIFAGKGGVYGKPGAAVEFFVEGGPARLTVEGTWAVTAN